MALAARRGEASSDRFREASHYRQTLTRRCGMSRGIWEECLTSPNKVLLLLPAPHLIRPSFPRFTSVHNCWRVTLIPGPCLLIHILTQGVSFPVRHSAPTTLAARDNLSGNGHASIPASGQGIPTRPEDRGRLAQIYLKAIHSAHPGSPEMGALCPACRLLASCSWAAHFYRRGRSSFADWRHAISQP